ncbi:MAG: zinc-binding dehydrogenase, partial [Gemmatimonadales bacterium]
RQTALTSGGIDPVDLIFDTTGGELLAASPRLLASGGRTVTVAESPPAGVEADYFVVTPNREQLIEMSPLFEAGTIRVLIDSGFPLTQFREAFSRLAKRGKVGKVVLGVVDEST